MSGSMHQACQQAKTVLLAEHNGVDVAVDLIYQHMKKHAACAQLGSVSPPAHGGLGAAIDDDAAIDDEQVLFMASCHDSLH